MPLINSSRRSALKSFAWITTGILALPTGSSLLSSCQNAAKEPLIDYIPIGFTSTQFKDIVAIMNVILPESHIAGAVTAGVPQFSDVFFAEVTQARNKSDFNAAYENFAQFISTTHQKQFHEIDDEKKEAAFVAFAEQEGEWIDGERRFWSSMKAMTLFGYSKTEIGATKAFRYVDTPGRYEGCSAYTEGDASWAE